VESLKELVREVPIATHVRDLASMIILATHPQWEHAPEATRRYVRYGSSPRGAQALVLGGKVRALVSGRFNVSEDDVKSMVLPALRHRVIFNFEGEAEGVSVDTLLAEVVEAAEEATRQGKEVFLQ
jgi:MoxR-like ATPase